MTKKTSIQFTLTMLSTALFTLLFWDESIGINQVLFSSLIIALTYYLNSQLFTSTPAKIVSAGILFTAFLILYHNSSMSKFTHYASILALIGYSNHTQLRSLHFALIEGFLKFFYSFKNYSLQRLSRKSKPKSQSKIKSYLKLIFLPLAIAFIFLILFIIANPIFRELIFTSIIELIKAVDYITEKISISRILFTLLGLVISIWLIYKTKSSRFTIGEIHRSDNIVRKRIKHKIPVKILGLKNEVRTALMLIVMINVMLVVVNVIDINYVWFNFDYQDGMNLSQSVHEGTYVLIFSILLSMTILLFIFRKNINFYRNNKTVKLLSKIWIYQNVILVISVIFRTAHYIEEFGLAYKRIGVLFFLLAVIFGLLLLHQKIAARKTNYYLITKNGWFVYALLIIMSSVNWDGIIADHNLSNKSNIHSDPYFLLSLSDKTLPTLIKHEAFFTNYNIRTKNILEHRIILFNKRYEKQSWLSWNYAEYKTYQFTKQL